MKNRIFLLLAVVAVFAGHQSTQALAAQTSKFRTCKSFDGPFQIPASQQCPLSGYAQGSGVPTVIEGKRKAVTPARQNPNFRNCSGIDGPFQVPASQNCPLSGYAHY
ncbi:hypothetical protein [Mesorhizobium loti]|uniref:hypothetical protein n=1 Tax=Rhizobium loti TaxID=381 RepID=UPI001FDED297|nr:hypothetical protein [Mesorhizobium loti]